MADLIAIGYPDEATAAKAAEEARRLARDLVIEQEAIATVRRDAEGALHVEISHFPVGARATWGGIDREFADQVCEMLQPGTSALFLVVEKVTADRIVEGLAPFGGTELVAALDEEPIVAA